MDRKSKIKKRIISCLNIVTLLYTSALYAQTFEIGTASQIEGEVSFLEFSPPHRLSQIKKNDKILTGGSYLARDDSYMTVKVFDESYLRLNPKSKISIEYIPQSKEIKIYLLSGSLKAILGQSPKSKIEKMITFSGSAQFEASAAKFTVTRNLINDHTSVYVEKGAVISSLFQLDQKKDTEIIYSNEMTTMSDKDTEITSPRKIKEKELKFLHPSRYLPVKKQTMR